MALPSDTLDFQSFAPRLFEKLQEIPQKLLSLPKFASVSERIVFVSVCIRAKLGEQFLELLSPRPPQSQAINKMRDHGFDATPMATF